MPFGNREAYRIFSGQYCHNFKKISAPWKPEIESFRHFSKLKISYFNGKIPPISLKLNFTPSTLGCYGLIRILFLLQLTVCPISSETDILLDIFHLSLSEITVRINILKSCFLVPLKAHLYSSPDSH